MRSGRRLAVERMSDRQLWDRAVIGVEELKRATWTLTPARERDTMADNTLLVIRELRLRGTQLSLPLRD